MWGRCVLRSGIIILLRASIQLLTQRPEAETLLGRNGEVARFLHRRIIGDIKIDKKSTYSIQSITTYDANAKEVTEQTNAIIYFFDYRKNKESKVEKKAVVVSIKVANGIKK